MIFIFITVVVLVVGLIINIERKRIEAEKLRLKKIANQKSELNPFFNEIDDYYKELSNFKDKPKYISNYELYQFKELHKSLFEKFNMFEYEFLPDFDKEITTINQFKSNFNNLMENNPALRSL